MTDRFFWQRIRTDEDELIKAMNVAGDYLVMEYGGRKAKQQAEIELDLIKQLEGASGDAQAKCRALWALITTGKGDAAVALIEAEVAKLDHASQKIDPEIVHSQRAVSYKSYFVIHDTS